MGLAAKHKDLSSSFRTHVWEERTNSPRLSSDLHMCGGIFALMSTLVQTHKINKHKFLNFSKFLEYLLHA